MPRPHRRRLPPAAPLPSAPKKKRWRRPNPAKPAGQAAKQPLIPRQQAPLPFSQFSFATLLPPKQPRPRSLPPAPSVYGLSNDSRPSCLALISLCAKLELGPRQNVPKSETWCDSCTVGRFISLVIKSRNQRTCGIYLWNHYLCTGN